jgi:hypothetical protein
MVGCQGDGGRQEFSAFKSLVSSYRSEHRPSQAVAHTLELQAPQNPKRNRQVVRVASYKRKKCAKLGVSENTNSTAVHVCGMV